VTPRYTLTPAIVRSLVLIEVAREAVGRANLTPGEREALRRQARLRSTHFSTRIEGNRLTLDEATRVITESGVRLPGRERDIGEVRHYWHALRRVEEWAAEGLPVTEERLRRLHGLVERGPRAGATRYRNGQNAIRDAATGALVYLPPEAKDVPGLMAEFVRWLEAAERAEVPVPVVAGLAHYQFVTIHPFFDGNGRTARLLTTWILERSAPGLGGALALEEHHARDLASYYRALVTHPHHNYYEGRETADLTSWLSYFVGVLAEAIGETRLAAEQAAGREPLGESALLRRLEPRARAVLGLFAEQETVTTRQVARLLALSERMARVLVAGWVHKGWLEVAEPSRRTRAYSLSAMYRQFIGNRRAGAPSPFPE
jgi:Fic family protein